MSRPTTFIDRWIEAVARQQGIGTRKAEQAIRLSLESKPVPRTDHQHRKGAR